MRCGYFYGGMDLSTQELVKKKASASLKADIENKELIRKYRETGDKQYKEEFFEKNERLSLFTASKWGRTTDIPFDDLASLARYGMLKAFNSFDLDRDIRFATYSTRCMDNEVLMELRKGKKHRGQANLEQEMYQDSEGNGLSLEDVTEDSYTSSLIDRSVDRTAIDALIRAIKTELSDDQLFIFYNMISEERKSQKEIAHELQFSQSYISRLETVLHHKARDIASRLGFSELSKFNTTYDRSKRYESPSEDEVGMDSPVVITNAKELDSVGEVKVDKLNGMNLREKIEYLMDNHPELGGKEIAVCLGRNTNSVYTYMSQIRSERKKATAVAVEKPVSTLPKNESKEVVIMPFYKDTVQEAPKALPVVGEDKPVTTKKISPPTRLELNFVGVDIEQIAHFLAPYQSVDGTYKVFIAIEKEGGGNSQDTST